MSSTDIDSSAAPEVLTVDELAAMLRLDRKTVYAMVAEGEVPGVRRCRRIIRIHRPTVVAWLAGQDDEAHPGRNR